MGGEGVGGRGIGHGECLGLQLVILLNKPELVKLERGAGG